MFDGLLVVELSSVLAGPLVGQFLAELGARVIKIENSKAQGDVTRKWKLASESPETDRSAYFLCANFAKESIALDLTLSSDLQLCRSIIAQADVLIHNFKFGDAERYGLSYEECKQQNPALIYASISGYGTHDPRVGYDAVIQAQSGFMWMNGEPYSPPTKLPVALIDVLAAQQLRQAVLLALIHRERSGEGSQVHCSLMNAALSALVNQASNVLNAGVEPVQSGSDHPNIAPYGTLYKTADDQWFLVAIGTDHQFDALVSLLELERHERFLTNQLRVQNREELQQILRQNIALWNSQELDRRCQECCIPAAVVQSVSAALHEPMFVHDDKELAQGAVPKASDTLLMRYDGVVGIRTIAFEGTFLEQINCKAAPHFDQHGSAIRSEFGQKSV